MPTEDRKLFVVGIRTVFEGSEAELYEKFDGSTQRYGRYLFEKARRWPSLAYEVMVAGFNEGEEVSNANQ